MSGITTVYNALVTRIETVLDVSNNDYYRISNPYVVEDNPETKLRKGYGVALLAAENANLEFCKLTQIRTFEIVLTRLYTGYDDNAVDRATVELEILEDEFLLLNNLEQDASLNNQTIAASYVSDSGIEFVAGETGRFFSLRIQLSVRYSDNFT
jgi:hypothetical protein